MDCYERARARMMVGKRESEGERGLREEMHLFILWERMMP